MATALHVGDLSGQKLSGMRRLADLEANRKKIFVSQMTLADSAGIHERRYRRLLSRPDTATEVILVRLERALARIEARAPRPHGDATLVAAVYAGFLVQMASFYGVTVAQVRLADPQRIGTGGEASWLACSHARQAAIYLVNTALDVRQRRLAEIVGVTPAAVCLAIRSVEDRREDPAFDKALRSASWAITGRDE